MMELRFLDVLLETVALFCLGCHLVFKGSYGIISKIGDEKDAAKLAVGRELPCPQNRDFQDEDAWS